MKRSKYERDLEDLYQEYDEEEAASANEDAEIVDVELEGKKKRSKRKQEIGNLTFDDKKEVPLIASQQSCKDVDSEVRENLIEIPKGLPQTSQRSMSFSVQLILACLLAYLYFVLQKLVLKKIKF